MANIHIIKHPSVRLKNIRMFSQEFRIRIRNAKYYGSELKGTDYSKRIFHFYIVIRYIKIGKTSWTYIRIIGIRIFNIVIVSLPMKYRLSSYSEIKNHSFKYNSTNKVNNLSLQRNLRRASIRCVFS